MKGCPVCGKEPRSRWVGSMVKGLEGVGSWFVSCVGEDHEVEVWRPTREEAEELWGKLTA